MSTPIPEQVVTALQSSPAQVFCHDIVMDAIDLSLALDRHVLLYGLEGLFMLETETASWRLPPTRAAWVPAGTHLKATTIRAVECTSLFFQVEFAEPLSSDCRIFGVTPVVREMIAYARRWSVDGETINEAHDDEVQRFFLTLLDLCRGQLRQEHQFALPRGKSPETNRALEYVRVHLAEDVTVVQVAKHAAMSARTLQRRLRDEIHMTFGEFLRSARMLRAMELLADGRQVTETSFDVGYSNMAAFSTAFRKFTDMTPTEYQASFLGRSTG